MASSIKLIREDFNLLIDKNYKTTDKNYESFSTQYSSSMDCPIARALNRQGIKKGIVGPNSISYYENTKLIKEVFIHGFFSDIVRVSSEILNGAEYGEIFYSE